jgi:hypothetical protein
LGKVKVSIEGRASIRAEKSLYDLATWCRARPGLGGALVDTPFGRGVRPSGERIFRLLEWPMPCGANGGRASNVTWIATGA